MGKKTLNSNCAICGKAIQYYESQKRTYCSRKCYLIAHSEKIKIKECIICGEKIVRSDSPSTQRKYRICSLACLHESLKKPKEMKCCLVCKQPFRPRRNNNKYCSKKCQHKGFRTNHEYVCAVCGKSFYRSKANATGKETYCSNVCFYKGCVGKPKPPRSMVTRIKISNGKKGFKNPAWKGGKDPERKKHSIDMKYKLWRTTVFERDNHTCQRCFKRGGSLQAHHILSWAEHTDKRFDVNNGLTLCVDCHKKESQKGNHISNKYRRRLEPLQGLSQVL